MYFIKKNSKLITQDNLPNFVKINHSVPQTNDETLEFNDIKQTSGASKLLFLLASNKLMIVCVQVFEALVEDFS